MLGTIVSEGVVLGFTAGGVLSFQYKYEYVYGAGPPNPLQQVGDVGFSILIFILFPTLMIYISSALIGNAWRRRIPETSEGFWTPSKQASLAIAGIFISFVTSVLGIVLTVFTMFGGFGS